MERRIHRKIEEYTKNLRNNFEKYVNEIETINNNDKLKIIQFIMQYPAFELTKDDFQRRKRVKNVVPFHERCMAKRANGERCTRRKKDDLDYCGTHSKGQPHGIINEEPPKEEFKKIVVKAQDIKGIIYYLDEHGNVYDPSDILNSKRNPKIIAKYTFNNNTYSIPEFGI